jgi:hypothetical protein
MLNGVGRIAKTLQIGLRKLRIGKEKLLNIDQMQMKIK